MTLLFIWLNSPGMALVRVAKRVSRGGHNIPPDVIERKYFRGIENLFSLYKPACDNWIIINNMNEYPEIVAQGSANLEETVINNDIWNIIQNQRHGG